MHKKICTIDTFLEGIAEAADEAGKKWVRKFQEEYGAQVGGMELYDSHSILVWEAIKRILPKIQEDIERSAIDEEGFQKTLANGRAFLETIDREVSRWGFEVGVNICYLPLTVFEQLTFGGYTHHINLPLPVTAELVLIASKYELKCNYSLN